MAVTAASAVEAVFRIESARIIAGVARIVRDVGIAEELAQDALVAALEQWPESGVPDNPGAWLMATAKHRAIDLVRRRETYARKLAGMGRDLDTVSGEPDPGAADPDRIDDDLLRLIFTSCHPVLSTDARIALTLRLLGGLTTGEIARAFLTTEAGRRPEDRPRQTGARPGRSPLRGAVRTRARRPARIGARSHLPGLQRGLRRDHAATTGCAPASARTRCGWPGYWAG